MNNYQKSEKAKAMVNKYSTSNALKYILQLVILILSKSRSRVLNVHTERISYNMIIFSFRNRTLRLVSCFCNYRFYWAVVNSKEFGCKHETNRNVLFLKETTIILYFKIVHSKEAFFFFETDFMKYFFHFLYKLEQIFIW